MYPHRIRLRGPWQFRAGGDVGNLTLPCALAGGPLAGRTGTVRLTRRFGYPGRIDPTERVWLCVDAPAAAVAVSLNGRPLMHRPAGGRAGPTVREGACGPDGTHQPSLTVGPASRTLPPGLCMRDGAGEWDVTELLSPRNELVIDTAIGPGEPWREVALVVRRTAFLRDVRVRVEGGIVRATGTVAGHAEGPLELYLVADRHTAAYTTLTTSEVGTPFALSGECEPPHLAKVELVQGAVAWYTAEFDLSPPGVPREG